MQIFSGELWCALQISEEFFAVDSFAAIERSDSPVKFSLKLAEGVVALLLFLFEEAEGFANYFAG